MTVNSTSTLAQVEAAYDDNASYAETGDIAKCRLFITACRILIRRMPAEAEHSGQASARLKLSPDLLQNEMKAAMEWLSQHSTDPIDNPLSTYGDFRNSRGRNGC